MFFQKHLFITFLCKSLRAPFDMQTYVADLKRSPCVCSLYPAEMSPNTSLDFQHV